MMPLAGIAAGGGRRSALAALHSATKVMGAVLAVITSFIVPAWAVPLWLLLLGLALWTAGATAGDHVRTVRPWWPMILLVIALHTLTTTTAAPLGRPSWTGFARGWLVLGRLAASVGSLSLALRVLPLAELTSGLFWWLRPAQRWGLDFARLGLVIAVALSTVPQAVSEGRRVEAVVRLRRGGHSTAPHSWRCWWVRISDRGHVVVPLLESVFRRAESLSLALQGRLPRPAAQTIRPPFSELGGLVVWAGVLLRVGWRW